MKSIKLQAKYIVPIVALLCCVILFVYLQSDVYKENQQQKEVVTAIEGAGKLMQLPESEPVVFRIEDPNLLTSQQAFFEGAQKVTCCWYILKGKKLSFTHHRRIRLST